jgi:hypothetical protein
MRRTLLDMTQSVLSALDSDPVSSISDTYEAGQIAERIRDAYLDLIDEQGLKANKVITTLIGLASTTRPHVLKIADNVSRLLWFNYDIRESSTAPLEYRELTYMEPNEFVRFCNGRDSTNTTEFFVWGTNAKMVIGKKEMPTYWTSFSDQYIVCDSYDSTVDSALVGGKTQVYVELIPFFTMEDDFIPELPENLFTLLHNTVLNRCYMLDKEKLNPKFEQQEQRSRVRSQRLKYRLQREQNKEYQTPDYGRRRP